jgi:hypothetical protein
LGLLDLGLLDLGLLDLGMGGFYIARLGNSTSLRSLRLGGWAILEKAVQPQMDLAGLRPQRGWKMVDSVATLAAQGTAGGA